MMNMMQRFTEGRGHLREIDMLLEITCVNSSTLYALILTGDSTANKLKVAPFAHWAMPLPGRFKVSCATFVRSFLPVAQLALTCP
jgi:hypothetical protein